MARSLNASMNFAGIDQADLKLLPAQKIHVGVQLLNILIETTQLVELTTTTTKYVRSPKQGGVVRRDKREIRATADTIEWLSKKNAALELLTPVVLPMVVPPLQWAKGQRGGYRYAMRNTMPIARGAQAATIAVIENTEMPEVFTAVNAIQNTAWTINPFVLDTMAAIYESGGGMAGIAALDNEELPAKPEDIEENEESRRVWRKQAHEVRKRNVQRGLKALEFIRVYDTARLMAKEEAFFFPHNLDFRGRMYPVTNYLTPQGDDLSRGLLTFAQGKPMLDALAARYLAQHGANCLDTTPEGIKLSKASIAERVQWVEEHTEAIAKVVSDPMTHTWWAKAEDPFQFLAFCEQWTNWKREGVGYVCALPVAIDGSCNGLQHFSAMLRDEVGAKAVNVTPNQLPEDIYQIVADKVLDALQAIVATGEEHRRATALLWLSSGLVTRKITKRPTMTFPYGSKRFGFQSQILHFLQHNDPDRWPAIREHFSGDIIGPADMLAQCIWEAVTATVGGAADGMAWFQKAARVVAKGGKALEWKVPSTGFPVRQEYFVMQKQLIHTMIAGQAVRPVLYNATPEIELHKQANAVAPNVVHSLDAAALVHTVKQAKDEGVESFAAVHDSYATVPADMAVLANAARMSFVKLYSSHHVIQELYEQFVKQAPPGKTVPPPPNLGLLDVNAVMASEYFFA
jgi:DNA-directed RNA polymerase